jgi:secondary thiamine-phosphate synthase enzyme
MPDLLTSHLGGLDPAFFFNSSVSPEDNLYTFAIAHLHENILFISFNSSIRYSKMVIQKEITLKPRPRGFHLITSEIVLRLPELKSIKAGIAHIFIQHTSASLTINENADPSVRTDMETYFNKSVSEKDAHLYEHTLEGTDDMTSHIKASIIGSNVSVPVTNGRFNLGMWQGIYLCEHRNHGGAREIVVTLIGE